MLGRGEFYPPSPSVVEWSHWVACQMGVRGATTAPASRDGVRLLPCWILGLTVDAAFQALMALGIRRDRHQRISAADAVRMRTPVQISEVIERGIGRGWVLDAPSTNAIQGLDGWVYEEGIERLARRAMNDADRTFAKTLVHALRRVNYRRRATGRRPAAVQFELFEGFDA